MSGNETDPHTPATHLEANPAGADGEVPDLAVPHEPGRKPHGQPTGLHRQVLALGEPVHHRGGGILDGIACERVCVCG